MATCRTRRPFAERLVDNAIGGAVGAVLGVLLWLVTLWLLAR